MKISYSQGAERTKRAAWLAAQSRKARAVGDDQHRTYVVASCLTALATFAAMFLLAMVA